MFTRKAAMTDKPRDYDILMESGTIVHGVGKLLMIDGTWVGSYFPTNDGLHHVLDDNGSRLDAFATAEEAEAFIKAHWNDDGTIDAAFTPIKLQ
jgi:hypothetical protein